MAKYTRLTTHLRASRRAEVQMTFADIETVIGAELPDSAHNHRAWWSNNPSSSVATKAWLAAGYESAQVDMKKEELLFRKVVPVSASPGVGPGPQTPNAGSGPVGASSGANAQVAPQIGTLHARIDDVHRDMRDFRDDILARLNDFDTRLRAVEVSFGKVDQRILTLERVVLLQPLGPSAVRSAS